MKPQAKQLGTSNAKFTGTLTIPSMALGGYGSAAMTVAPPAGSSDVLAAGEGIVLQPSAPLPNGVNLSYGIVTGPNQVTVYFTSNALLSTAQSASFSVYAQRFS